MLTSGKVGVAIDGVMTFVENVAIHPAPQRSDPELVDGPPVGGVNSATAYSSLFLDGRGDAYGHGVLLRS